VTPKKTPKRTPLQNHSRVERERTRHNVETLVAETLALLHPDGPSRPTVARRETAAEELAREIQELLRPDGPPRVPSPRAPKRKRTSAQARR
jgi:hypothetical protein